MKILNTYSQLILKVLPKLKYDAYIISILGASYIVTILIWLIYAVINPQSPHVYTILDMTIPLGKLYIASCILTLLKWFVISIVDINLYRMESNNGHGNPIDNANK